jgi:hypothetical protein
MECISVLDLDLDPTKNGIQKPNKVKKIKNEMTTFWETMLLLTLKRQDFVPIFFCSKYGMDPAPDLDSEPELFHSRNGNHMHRKSVLTGSGYEIQPMRRNPTEPVSPKNTLLWVKVLEEARLVLSQNIRQVEFALIQQVDIWPNLHKEANSSLKNE